MFKFVFWKKAPRGSQDPELFTMRNYQKFQVVSFVHDLTGNISAKFNLIHIEFEYFS
jgi:hypothetical protein